MCMSLVHQLVATIKEDLFHALESQLADRWGGAGSPPRGHSSRSGLPQLILEVEAELQGPTEAAKCLEV